MRRANQNKQQLPAIGAGIYGGMAAQLTAGSRTIEQSSADEFLQCGMDIGVSSKQGKRPYQEDEFACKAFISSGAGGKGSVETHFVGLFDGHAGGRCSKYLATAMAQTLAEDPQFDINLPQAMKRSFHTINDNFLKVADKIRLQDGSTGICVIMREEKYLVANVGDCRAVIISSGQAIQLSKDQKPTSPEEQKRIYALGGTVVNCMGVVRVNGVLAVSRAFGNRSLRDVIRPDAEITQRSMGLMDDFLVLASDGLWDVLSNATVAEVCQRMSTQPAAAIAEELVNNAISRGSMDNVTCICIKLGKFMSRVLDEGTAKAMAGRERSASTASDNNERPHMRRLNVNTYTQVQDATSQSNYQNRNSSVSPSSVERMMSGASDSNTTLRPGTTSTGASRGSGYGQDRISPQPWRQQQPNANALHSQQDLVNSSLPAHMTYNQPGGAGGGGGGGRAGAGTLQQYGQQPYGQQSGMTMAGRRDPAGSNYGPEPISGNRYMAAYNSYHREREDHIKLAKDLFENRASMPQMYANNLRPMSQSQSSHPVSGLSQGSTHTTSSGYGQNNRATGSLSNVAFRSISGETMSSESLSLTKPVVNNRLLHSPITTKAQGTKYTSTGRASTANTVSRRSVIKRKEI